MKTRSTALALAASLSTLLAAEGANAQSFFGTPYAHEARFNLELHGIVNYSFWGEAFSPGVGLRFQIPLLRNGFVRSVNNSVYLGIGLDAFFYTSWYRDPSTNFHGSLQVPIMLTWNFHLAPRFTLFLEAGVAPTFGFWNGYYDNCNANVGWCYLTPGAAIGGHVHFRAPASYPAFTFRVGFPTGLTLGITF